MRLIDADALIEKLQRNSAFGMVRNAADKNVYEIIAEQPTAYDIEKVAAELEEYEQGRLEMYDWQGQSAVSDAIDIVRKGGVE